MQKADGSLGRNERLGFIANDGALVSLPERRRIVVHGDLFLGLLSPAGPDTDPGRRPDQCGIYGLGVGV